ncbi:MAG TPA: toll/interleukin-1 receptor domain-containing protein [Pyrinomonadaceae bacterium]|nr:toll/interleukin-1 receptor domain-containing protein [Pyrinomonadaceae bacterium]
MAEYDVFVSYSHKDVPFVRRLVNALEARGIKAWYDSEVLRVGESFMRQIGDALEQSRYFLLVISPDYLAGQWTSFELGVALGAASTRGERIIPILVRKSDLSALPNSVRKHRFLDATLASAEQIAAEVAEVVKQDEQVGLAENPDHA